MKHLVEFPLDEGGSILIEVTSDDTKGMTPATALSDIPQKAQQTFETALDRVRLTANAILTKIRSLPDTPNEVEVEFGIKMDAEAGAIISTVGLEANFKIVLKWQKEEK